ncbi:MAG: metallophosphoesterase [Spirochaetaceae bacterium]|jgi:Icc-related predicted phosphoesterase|nr:metallophosphoesterase [Spirochaetaceae bacterium]
MKILCISDHIDPLVYTNTIKDRFGDIDMILSAGDLPMDYLDFVVSSLNKPLLFVFGNHDNNHFKAVPESLNPFGMVTDFPPSAGIIHVGSRVRYEEGLICAGLGGSRLYNNGENQYTELQMKCEMAKLIPRLLLNRLIRGRFLDVLLTHASPFGIHDKPDRCHQGFKCFLWFMRVFKPKYLIHGHIHLYDSSEVRTTRYHNTLVLNAYSHYIIDTDEYQYTTKEDQTTDRH